MWSSPTLSADGATLFVGSADYNVYALKTVPMFSCDTSNGRCYVDVKGNQTLTQCSATCHAPPFKLSSSPLWLPALGQPRALGM